MAWFVCLHSAVRLQTSTILVHGPYVMVAETTLLSELLQLYSRNAAILITA